MSKEEQLIHELHTALNNVTALFCAFNGTDYTTVSDAIAVLQKSSTHFGLPVRAHLSEHQDKSPAIRTRLKDNQPLDEDIVYDVGKDDRRVEQLAYTTVNLAVSTLPLAEVTRDTDLITFLREILGRYSDYCDPDLAIPIAFRRELYVRNYREEEVQAMEDEGEVDFSSDEAFRWSIEKHRSTER